MSKAEKGTAAEPTPPTARDAGQRGDSWPPLQVVAFAGDDRKAYLGTPAPNSRTNQNRRIVNRTLASGGNHQNRPHKFTDIHDRLLSYCQLSV